ncbi:MAG: DMT family transporter [Actinobacteria bacterium]|nr:DMT family transporter [Actinomycetota bacterium]
MEILLAAAAALVYGVGDYCGGRASRKIDSLVVTCAGQIFSLMLLGIFLVILGDPAPGMHDWLWGAAGGLGGFVGLTLFYYALAKGSMTVVAPLAAVVSAALPVGTGLFLGDRPSLIAYVGIVIAIVGIALVTGAVGTAHAPTKLAIVGVATLAGCGFGWMFVCLDRTSSDSGMWPLLAARIASISIAATIIAFRGRSRLGQGRIPAIALWAGFFDMGANVLFVFANRHGMLSLVSVITALYPVSTIVLALRLDHEKANHSQFVGMACAALALVFVSLGR